MLIFDIGFNHGNFTKEVLSIYPNSKVVGVEGHPMYEMLFRQNPISNVEFIAGVVSDVDSDEMSMYLCDSNPGINSINPKWIDAIRHQYFFNNTKREIKVKSYTIDTLVRRYGNPDIIKLDIEGAELFAIRGMSKKSETILFEWCEEFFDDTIYCVKLLKDLGYTRFASDSHWEGSGEKIMEYNPNLEYDEWDNVFKKCDIVPERKKRWGMIYAR
jgi:FkbM family methyltransferase